MRLLHFVLIEPERLPSFPSDAWGEPPVVPEGLGKGVASALYSDVGSTFYRLCGPGKPGEHQDKAWITHDAIGTTWPVDSSNTTGDESSISKVEWVSQDQLNGLWDQDTLLLKEELVLIPNPPTVFSFLPSGGIAWFLFVRNRNFIPPEWKNDRWGAKIIKDGKLSFATWALDSGRSGPSTLIITRLRADEDTLPILLDCAKKVAKELSLEQVEVWNLPERLSGIGEKLGGTTAPREDHLPALAWFGEGDVIWKRNEKFCWC